MTLPDCPYCDSTATLERIDREGRGVTRCLCSCCGKTCQVDADGVVVPPKDVRDTNGVVMYDP